MARWKIHGILFVALILATLTVCQVRTSAEEVDAKVEEGVEASAEETSEEILKT